MIFPDLIFLFVRARTGFLLKKLMQAGGGRFSPLFLKKMGIFRAVPPQETLGPKVIFSRAAEKN